MAKKVCVCLYSKNTSTLGKIMGFLPLNQDPSDGRLRNERTDEEILKRLLRDSEIKRF